MAERLARVLPPIETAVFFPPYLTIPTTAEQSSRHGHAGDTWAMPCARSKGVVCVGTYSAAKSMRQRERNEQEAAKEWFLLLHVGNARRVAKAGSKSSNEGYAYPRWT